MADAPFVAREVIELAKASMQIVVDARRPFQLRERRRQRSRGRLQDTRHCLNGVDALSNAWAVVARSQLRPRIPQMRSCAVKLGSGDISKRACQSLPFCIRSNGDDRIIVKERVGGSARSEGIALLSEVWDQGTLRVRLDSLALLTLIRSNNLNQS